MSGLDGLLGDNASSNESVKSEGGRGGIGLDNAILMADARVALADNWGVAVLGTVLYSALMMSFSFFMLAAGVAVGAIGGAAGADVETAGGMIQLVSSLGKMIIYGPVIVGFMGFFLGISREKEAHLERLFIGFKRFWKSFGVYFFYSLFVILWMLLFIIPGIIATFRYAMAFFIIADDAECGALEAITRSKEMMVGNKWKFFCLNCRFIGWSLLATFFTLGIGYLWLIPYMNTSFAKFYEDVK